MNKTVIITIRVGKKDLFFVDNIFKAYEGLALVSVIRTEGNIGRLRIEATQGTKEDVLEIIEDLKNKVDLEIIGIE